MPVVRSIRRGEVYAVDIDLAKPPPLGHEQRGRRFWVIVSAEAIHRRLEIVQAVPLTSRLHQGTGHPYRIHIPRSEIRPASGGPGLDWDALALTEQLRVLAHDRLDGKPVGVLAPATMSRVEAGIRFVLAIPA